MNFLPIILDIIIVLILVLLTYFGYKSGLVRTVVNLVSYLVSLVGAYFFSGILSKYFAQMSRGWFLSFVNDKIGAAATENMNEAIVGAFEKMPAMLTNFVEKLFGSQEEMIAKITEGSGGAVESIAGQITDVVILPMVAMFMQVILFILIFAGIMFILKLFAKSLNIINRLPLVGGVNRILGGVLGLVQAIIVVFIIVTIVDVLLVYTTIPIDNGFIYPIISQINPFSIQEYII